MFHDTKEKSLSRHFLPAALSHFRLIPIGYSYKHTREVCYKWLHKCINFLIIKLMTKHSLKNAQNSQPQLLLPEQCSHFQLELYTNSKIYIYEVWHHSIRNFTHSPMVQNKNNYHSVAYGRKISNLAGTCRS